jgi:probable rRNA maturation factor
MTEIDILIANERWTGLGFDPEELARRAAMTALVHADLPAPLTRNHDMELAMLLTGDDGIQAMNRDFRGKDKPTNVLSFASVDDPDFQKTAKMPGPFYLGDLALALETLEREAEDQNKALEDHFTHLVVHGTLHLLRYDHIGEADAERMEALEIKILNTMGIENPYLDPLFVPD